MYRIFIAIAAAALAFVPNAQATQTVEADNGAVYEILYTVHANDGHAEAHILTADHEQITFQFDCHGRMLFFSGLDSSSGIRAIPPRSVAAKISQIACNGPGQFPQNSVRR